MSVLILYVVVIFALLIGGAVNEACYYLKHKKDSEDVESN